MDRRHVRIGVFSAGIISGLLLLLYLPVLIWSPPWSPYGLYKLNPILPDDPTSNEISYLNLQQDCVIVNHHENNESSNMTINIKHNISENYWETIDRKEKGILEVREAQLFVRGEDQDSPTKGSHKISNPFTLWHIKWLEWTTK